MSIDTPRPPLNNSMISEKISQYWRVSVVEVTGSTQDDLAKLATKNLASNGDVLVAEYQSAGRGRLDRTFEAPHGSALLFSLYLEPKLEKSDWSFLPLLAGLGCTLALSELDPKIKVELKWPNDLQISGKKLGGIIAHLSGRGVILGIGINVGMSKEELPIETGTSLMIEEFQSLDRNILTASILSTFEEIFGRWEDGEDLRHLYRERSATLLRKVLIEMPGREKITGFAEDISSAGELILEGGERITVGDIIHLR